ncbi:NADH-quinone oxidoreductase subunit C [Salinibacillus xinjiangensis]|uniref:NAD(P)H dehydrogenase subunit J n=1 Tax=Salinibacillus xinjiangensis TaxID=1229268 RepID=A0A6G1X5I8_9BACI|nr:NADH-quinone oxidoreductase subunit C [Salinibacillus xinjiangensis]MRG86189.1 NADH-quinone oxidoreductase subunit C [Salinibacillus xinjiangensis]
MTDENQNQPQSNEENEKSKVEETKNQADESQKEPKAEPTTPKEESPSNKESTKNAKEDTSAKTDKPKPKKDRPKRPRKPRAKKEEKPEDLGPSPNQPILDHYVNVIKTNLGEEAIEEASINRNSKDLPTIVATPKSYFQIAKLLRDHEELQFNYLSDLHGIDYETHMEMYVYLYSMTKKYSVALKVKVDREHPVVDSLTPIWQGANWPESEAYDLLGIQFNNHPDLKRILLGEDWEGYPLRKDYEPYDVEV